MPTPILHNPHPCLLSLLPFFLPPTLLFFSLTSIGSLFLILPEYGVQKRLDVVTGDMYHTLFSQKSIAEAIGNIDHEDALVCS